MRQALHTRAQLCRVRLYATWSSNTPELSISITFSQTSMGKPLASLFWARWWSMARKGEIDNAKAMESRACAGRQELNDELDGTNVLVPIILEIYIAPTSCAHFRNSV